MFVYNIMLVHLFYIEIQNVQTLYCSFFFWH